MKNTIHWIDGNGDLAGVELTDDEALQLELGRSVAFEGAVRPSTSATGGPIGQVALDFHPSRKREAEGQGGYRASDKVSRLLTTTREALDRSHGRHRQRRDRSATG
jgi:hypothetical protein